MCRGIIPGQTVAQILSLITHVKRTVYGYEIRDWVAILYRTGDKVYLFDSVLLITTYDCSVFRSLLNRKKRD